MFPREAGWLRVGAAGVAGGHRKLGLGHRQRAVVVVTA